MILEHAEPGIAALEVIIGCSVACTDILKLELKASLLPRAGHWTNTSEATNNSDLFGCSLWMSLAREIQMLSIKGTHVSLVSASGQLGDVTICNLIGPTFQNSHLSKVLL